MANPRILIIDDDVQHLGVLSEALSGRYEVHTASDPRQGLEKALALKPELAIIDVDMPGMTGFAVCQSIRENTANDVTSIVFLTFDSAAASMQQALKAGANDYLLKPFRIQDLITRIEFRLGQAHIDAPMRCGNLSVDAGTRSASLDVRGKRRQVRFTQRGFRLIQVFMKNEGRVLTREQLLDLAWDNDDDASDRSVDLNIFRLRRLLKGWDHEIEAVYGKGYAMVPRKRRT